jgi:hypothetical protein
MAAARCATPNSRCAGQARGARGSPARGGQLNALRESPLQGAGSPGRNSKTLLRPGLPLENSVAMPATRLPLPFCSRLRRPTQPELSRGGTTLRAGAPASLPRRTLARAPHLVRRLPPTPMHTAAPPRPAGSRPPMPPFLPVFPFHETPAAATHLPSTPPEHAGSERPKPLHAPRVHPAPVRRPRTPPTDAGARPVAPARAGGAAPPGCAPPPLPHRTGVSVPEPKAPKRARSPCACMRHAPGRADHWSQSGSRPAAPAPAPDAAARAAAGCGRGPLAEASRPLRPKHSLGPPPPARTTR